MIGESTAQVECYSGHTYAQRPVAFTWMEKRFEVEEIEAIWHDPQGEGFRVRTVDGQRFTLVYIEPEDTWVITVQ